MVGVGGGWWGGLVGGGKLGGWVKTWVAKTQLMVDEKNVVYAASLWWVFESCVEVRSLCSRWVFLKNGAKRPRRIVNFSPKDA